MNHTTDMPLKSNPTIPIETLLEYEPFVCYLLRGLVRDENQVQDLVQETWVKALGSPPKASGSPKGWLAKVVKNLARDSHRRGVARQDREVAVARPEGDGSQATSEQRLRLHRQLVNAVMDLDEPYRGVMILSYYEDLRPSQIAQKLDRKPATARSQIHRAHELLRENLDGEYGDRKSWLLVAVPMASTPMRAATVGAGLTSTPTLVMALIALVLFGGGIWLATQLVGSQDQNPLVGPSTDSALDPNPGAPDGDLEAGKVAAAKSHLANSQADSGQGRATPMQSWSVRVTEAGKPVVGAKVWVLLEDPSSLHALSPVLGTSYDNMAELSRRNPQATTEAQGLAAFQVPTTPTWVWSATETGGFAGLVQPGDAQPFELKLTPLTTVHVRVVDESDAPVGGVPVVLRYYLNPEGIVKGTGIESERGDISSTLSDPETGLATLHLSGPAKAVMAEDPKGRIRTYAWMLGIPGIDNEFHDVVEGVGSTAENPILCRVPNTGSLQVRVLEPDGTLSKRAGGVTLKSPSRVCQEGEVELNLELVDGEAQFSHVALGAEFTATFHSSSTGTTWTATGTGPTQLGEGQTLTIQGEQTGAIRGQLQGKFEPFADWSKVGLHMCVLDQNREELQRTAFQPKLDGSFQVALDPGLNLDQVVDLQIVGYYWTREEGLRPRWDLGAYFVLKPQGLDLGKVNLRWVSDRIHGRVVDTDGNGIEDARITVSTDRGGNRSTHMDETNSRGGFQLKTILAEETTVEVRAEGGWLKHKQIVKNQGDSELRIVLQRGAVCTGQILMPEGIPDYSLTVQVHPSGDQERDSTSPSASVDSLTGQFQVKGIAAGTHVVQVRMVNAPIMEIPGVRFEAGLECADARVQSIDLRDVLESKSLRVMGANGESLRSAYGSVSLKGKTVAYGNADSKGKMTLHLPKLPGLQVHLQASGYRAQSLALDEVSVSEVTEVRLSPGIEVRLFCANPPSLRQGRNRALLSLSRWKNDAQSEFSSELSVSLPACLFKDGAAKVVFPGPGTYVLFMSMHEDPLAPGGVSMAGMSTRCTFSSFELEIGEGDGGKSFEVELPADLFQR